RGPEDLDQPGGDHGRPDLSGAPPHGPFEDGGRGPRPASMSQDRGSALEVAEGFAASSPETSRSRTLVWQDPLPTASAGATMTGMEYMTAVVEAELPPPPIA